MSSIPAALFDLLISSAKSSVLRVRLNMTMPPRRSTLRCRLESIPLP
jgi:hypothetical protein